MTDENPDKLPFQSTHDINLLDVQYMQSNGEVKRHPSQEDVPAPSWITDHPFVKGVPNPFLCRTCNLAEASHMEVAEPHELVSNWRCEDCINQGVDPCTHEKAVVRRQAREKIANKGEASGAVES